MLMLESSIEGIELCCRSLQRKDRVMWEQLPAAASFLIALSLSRKAPGHL